MLSFGHQLALSGNIDKVIADGVVVGWCWSPDEPDTRRLVCLAIDGFDIAETTADENRPDLAAAGVGDGLHGFSIRLSPRDIPDRPNSVLTLRDVATGQSVGGEVPVIWPRAPVALPVLVGNLEQATQDGWVSGWAWYPAEPERRVNLDILVDGVLVGSTRASTFRADLENAGIGDGKYGFSFALPWAVLASKGEMTLSVRDALTGKNFGAPIVMRIGRLIDVEERIEGLERQVRLLQARLAEQEETADPRHEERAARELFRTVAAFFHDIAEAPDLAKPSGPSLRHAVGSVLDRHAPLTLAVPEQPAATLLLLGHAAHDDLYACLVGLQEIGADRLADLVLLDDSRQGAEMALLPAIVGNLRYVRVRPGADAAASRNEIARTARGDLLVVLSAHLRPAHDALVTLLDTFGDAPDVALASAAVLRADGMVEHAGYMMEGSGGMVAVGRAEDPAGADWTRARPVDAVADLFYAMRRAAFLTAGGFPPGYDTPEGALAGLCLALRGKVVLQPLARGTLRDDTLRLPSLSPEDSRRLRDRMAALR